VNTRTLRRHSRWDGTHCPRTLRQITHLQRDLAAAATNKYIYCRGLGERAENCQDDAVGKFMPNPVRAGSMVVLILALVFGHGALACMARTNTHATGAHSCCPERQNAGDETCSTMRCPAAELVPSSDTASPFAIQGMVAIPSHEPAFAIRVTRPLADCSRNASGGGYLALAHQLRI
jgi:hypothetical protein